jgi:branched-chain amino acid transport system permease protein
MRASLSKNVVVQIIILTILAVLLIVPFFVSPYVLLFLFLLFTYIVLAESYDLLAGYGGYVNLGMASFFGVGAYLFALLYRAPDPFVKVGFQLPLPVAFIGATFFTVAIASGLTYPLFRLRGAYFSVCTLAVLLLIYYLVMNLSWITGGYRGLSIPSIPHGKMISYYLGLGTVLACLLTYRRIIKGKLGLALLCIKEDEDVAECSGINVYRCKAAAFIISALFASLIGEIYVLYMSYVFPDAVLGLTINFAPVIMAMLGGSGIALGPLTGAIILKVVEELIFLKTPYLRLFTYGIILVIIGTFLPAGFVGSIRKTFPHILKKRFR